MKINQIKIGSVLTHQMTTPNIDGEITQTVKVLGFDRLAIEVETIHGTRFWCNSWELSK